eukprot:TRINITY_DN10196_c0_g1_i1.p1 TRINITY_DN10196_c0_g1~~TRINITY_DN10196_c0_g1_i1.p1  ORF type:complete len:224 (-),score=61.75 TRINITY_DN10196_c0_g1_i1:329-1000(-)
MLVEDVETVVKVITVGNGAVGKTSLIRRFCNGVFTGEYQKTLSVDFVERQEFTAPGVPEPVRLHVWDTAGQEEYDAITASYYRGAQAAILCFASDDPKSLADLDKWKDKVDEKCPSIPMVIVQTKLDLIGDASKEIVSKDKAEAKAAELGMKLFRTSVKDDKNVTAVFESVVEQYHQQKQKELAQAEKDESTKQEAQKNKSKDEGTVDIKPSKNRAKKKDGCC